MCKIIENSDVHKATFERFVCEIERSPTADSVIQRAALKTAKYRFESCATPMGRFVLWNDAVISTHMHIMRTRAGRREAKKSEDVLTFLDDERVLTVAMIADAGDEVLCLKRVTDTEACDPAEIKAACQALLKRIDFLFVQGKCVHYGYTRHALGLLSKPRTIALRTGPKSFGSHRGVSAAIVERCLQRMRVWVWLAVTTMKAELPHWEVTLAFTIFQLDRHAPSGAVDATALPEYFARLGRVFGVPERDLRDEWALVLPVAVEMRRSGTGVSNVDAWRHALTELPRRAKNECPSLSRVMQSYVAYQGCTTSGVEQNFSNILANVTKSRNHMLESRENDENTIRTMPNISAEVDATLTEAERVWQRVYGCVRSTVRPARWDKGTQRKRDGGKLTIGSWIRKRRAEVSSAVASLPQPTDASIRRRAAELGAPAVTDKIVAEAVFQVAKWRKKKLEGVRAGTVVSEDLVGEAEQLFQHEQELARKRQKAEQRAKSLPPEYIHAVPCFASADVDMAPLQQALARNAMTVHAQRMQAKLFLVADPAAPGRRTRLAAALTGGRVAEPRFVLSGGKRGASIQYRSAMETRRLVWMSRRFKAEHAQLAGLVDQAVALPRCKWRVLPTRTAFLREHAKAVGRRRGRQWVVIALVVPADRRAPPLRALPNLTSFLGHTFVEWVAHIDRQRCTSGMCGQ